MYRGDHRKDVASGIGIKGECAEIRVRPSTNTGNPFHNECKLLWLKIPQSYRFHLFICNSARAFRIDPNPQDSRIS
jgi:hypothetical protein